MKRIRGLERCLPAIPILLTLFFPAALDAREVPPSLRLPALSLDKVDQRVLTGLDNAMLLTAALDQEADSFGVPMRFAEPVHVDFHTGNSGTWEDLPDGSHLWRLEIVSGGAASMNLSFSTFDPGNGARLWIYDPAAEIVQGPFTNRHRSQKGRLFTPLVLGDRVVVELHVPAGQKEATHLQIGAVNHGFREFEEKQGSCNNDVVCPEGDPWRDQIRSVARYTISGFTLCTGQLLNNTALDGRPLFLSAQHCGITPASQDSLVVYWNFESPTCGQLGGGSLEDNQGGSTFLASHFASDTVLVELDESPDEFGVLYSGWNVTGATPQGAVAIHHPTGDEKAISFDNDPLIRADIGRGGDTHWEVSNWEDGTTEPGSSGACIWDPDDGLCVGVLTGGVASCTNIGFDVFGALDLAWEGGGTSDTRLKDWLDPLDTGVTTLPGSGGPQSSALDIQGPTGGLIGEHLTFEAVGLGCHPDDRPHTWSVKGLKIDAGPSITIAYEELGAKSLEVNHPSCSVAGQKTLHIVSEPAIIIEGPEVAGVDLLTELTALPIGCPAESDGWSWSAAGIEFIGGPVITLRFGAPGLENVSVSHPNCPAVGTLTIEVRINEIFADGFESGDTSTWTTTVPGAASDLSVQSTNVNNGLHAARLTVSRDCTPGHYTVPDGSRSSDPPVVPCGELRANDVEVVSGSVRFRGGLAVKLGEGFSVASGASLTVETGAVVSGAAFVRDESPAAFKEYVARFYIDPGSLSFRHHSQRFDHLTAYDGQGNREFVIGLTYNSGMSEMRLFATAFDNNRTAQTTKGTCELALLPRWQYVEVHWKASAGGNGDLELSIDGAVAQSLAACLALADGLDNSNGEISAVEWGARGIVGDTLGTVDLDDFASARAGTIGPL